MIVAILIVLIIFIRQKSDDVFQMLQQNATFNYNLIEDGHKIIQLDDEELKLYLVLDMQDNLHTFLLDEKKIIATNIIINVRDGGRFGEYKDVYWTAYENPGKYYFFAGALANDNIEHIEVNDLKKEEIEYYDFMGYKIFYTITKMNTPYLIKGYSSKNELIYTNHDI